MHTHSVAVPALMHGRLLEVNSRLASHGATLFEAPLREGYLAVLLASSGEADALKARLMDESAYLTLRELPRDELW